MPNSDVTSSGSPDARGFIEAMTDSTRAQSPAEFLERNGVGLRSPGLYSWWVDEQGAVELTRGLRLEVSDGLLYAGLAVVDPAIPGSAVD